MVNAELNFRTKRVSAINLESALVTLFAIYTFLSGSALTHGDTTLASGTIIRLVLTANRLLLFLCLFLVSITALKSTKAFKITASLFVPIITYLLIKIDSYTSEGVYIYTYLSLFIFLLMNKSIKKRTFVLFKNIFCVFCLIGIICWLLYMLRLRIFYSVVPYYSERMGGSYINFNFAYLVDRFGSLRLCAYFNEPGYLGTVAALFLCADELDLKKRENKIILIAGILAVSMAFFVIIAVYIFLRSYNRPKLMLLVGMVLFVYFVILPNIEFSNPVLARFVNRFLYTDSGFAGDNRSVPAIDDAMESVLTSGKAFWGMGTGYSADLRAKYAVATYKTFVIDYGIIGFFLMYGYPLLIAIKEAFSKKPAVFFVIVFFLSVYQRPTIYNMTYFVILFGGLAYMMSKEPSRLSKSQRGLE